MDLFTGGFVFLSVFCAGLFIYSRTALPSISDVDFSKFQYTYLFVYLLAMAGDWLQGPHVYALYQSYGLTTHDIEILFVAGFGSSMIFGTFVGSIADKYGRRTNCCLYGILYGLACVTKHFNNFWILMVGRLLGGIATSILYSAFESWLIYEHNKRGFSSDWLGSIFSSAVLGNSLVAIVAGWVAQLFADSFGFVAPFDVSMVVLIVMNVIIVSTWTENYGDSSIDVRQSFTNAIKAIKTDRKILCLGLIQSLFEGSMYTFVLEWTPALSPPVAPVTSLPDIKAPSASTISDSTSGHRGIIPHGVIFAAFMVAVMIGSSLFKMFSQYTSIESFMRFVLFVSGLALLPTILFPGNQLIIFCGFLVFEICVGIFWPSLSTMRGTYVPEETRATIMNCFRVPLNMIVVGVLLQNLPMSTIFKCCVVFLFMASLFQHWLYRLSKTFRSGVTSESNIAREEKVELI